MQPALKTLDHLVLTVSDIDRTVDFYREVLGMTPRQFSPADGSTRWALNFGDQKINLHQAGVAFSPKAKTPLPGSADLCFLSEIPVDAWMVHFAQASVPIESGPVTRTGATGPILSVYIRDPDGNLLEISNKTDG